MVGEKVYPHVDLSAEAEASAGDTGHKLHENKIMDEVEEIYQQIHWLFDQIALLEVEVKRLEEANYA